MLAALRALAAKNRPMVQMIGLGYSDTVTPAVIRRHIVESPAWYTASPPYQPEVPPGPLEAPPHIPPPLRPSAPPPRFSALLCARILRARRAPPRL